MATDVKSTPTGEGHLTMCHVNGCARLAAGIASHLLPLQFQFITTGS